LVVASGFYLCGCSSSLYLAKLGWGQANILIHSRSNQAVLEDPGIEESIKEKIRLVMDAKIYGEKAIGLAKTSNFTKFYQVEGSSLLYVVSASPRDRLEPYQWWFPVTGRVTMKGFFSYQDAIRERDKLERKGFDVFLQGARAYSTLGWFRDPIFSTMLDQDPAMVANVVIHELTHATVFFKDQLDFNEQIANFVGGQGAVDFTAAKFGVGSIFQKRAIGFLEDSVLFSQFMRGVYQKLDDLYARPVPSAVKLREREILFLEAKEAFNGLKRSLKTDFYLGFEQIRLNNAAVLALGRYIASIEQIQKVYEKLGRDLGRTVRFFKGIQKSGIKNPQDYVARWLEAEELEESLLLGQDLLVGSS
jgi:predicted aminopeptidase